MSRVTGPNKVSLLPGVSGGGLLTLGSIIKGAKNGAHSVAVVALGDSKVETANPGATIGTSRPIQQTWTRYVQRILDGYVGTQHIDIPLSYYFESSSAPIPGVAVAGGTTISCNNFQGYAGRGLSISAGGAVAIYLPKGANHVGVMLSDFGGVNGTFRMSVYSGDLSSPGSIPSAGSTTNRIADYSSGATYLSSYRIDNWGQNVLARDSNRVTFGFNDNQMHIVAESLTSQLNGCTIVLYKGNVSSGYMRIIAKSGGTLSMTG